MDLSENGEITPITIRRCQEGTWCSKPFAQIFRQTQKWLVLAQRLKIGLMHLYHWLVYVIYARILSHSYLGRSVAQAD